MGVWIEDLKANDKTAVSSPLTTPLPSCANIPCYNFCQVFDLGDAEEDVSEQIDRVIEAAGMDLSGSP